MVDPITLGCQPIICHADRDFKATSLTGEAIEELRCDFNGFAMPDSPLDGEHPEEDWQYTGVAKSGQTKYVNLLYLRV